MLGTRGTQASKTCKFCSAWWWHKRGRDPLLSGPSGKVSQRRRPPELAWRNETHFRSTRWEARGRQGECAEHKGQDVKQPGEFRGS